MALALSDERKGPGLREFIYSAKVTPSGNYVAGGEVLGLHGKMPTTKRPVAVNIRGRAGYVYEYDYDTDKMLVRQEGAAGAPAVEIAAAAYPAGVTGDHIRVEAKFNKFG